MVLVFIINILENIVDFIEKIVNYYYNVDDYFITYNYQHYGPYNNLDCDKIPNGPSDE